MARAKDIRVAPIAHDDADRLIRRLHYSHTVVRNSFLHFGVFLGDQLEGAMSIGPSMDKSRLIGLVRGTSWNGFAEINRMAFSERLPGNSESRAIAVAMRMLRKRAPHLQWLISFADATCCGDGTIYRAAGFALTGITKNDTILVMPNGERITNLCLTANWNNPAALRHMALLGVEPRYRTISEWLDLGARRAPGFQLRYIYFLDPAARARLTVPILPYSAIQAAGAGMYLGQPRDKQAMAEHPSAQRRGSTDHRAPMAPAAPAFRADSSGEPGQGAGQGGGREGASVIPLRPARAGTKKARRGAGLDGGAAGCA